ncbi:PREDICTED: protein FAM57A isoform X2 [Nicrophorus vespilloides]|uniref:Protein FAM57A isoform X2 n=1 Tax=Nicrophorus vespilloides TaxID=110193 RepID=A0ABM1MFR0_NICVS|nr:PREDICTED: protein FAM57A isoform X2 [Nicrophorus vespilloides]
MVNAKRFYTIYLNALVVGVTIGAAFYSVSDMEAEDNVGLSKGFSLFAMGGLFFTSLYNFCVHMTQKTVCGQRFIKRYKLSTSDVLDISNKIVSSVQALLSCLTGLTICSYSCNRNILRTSHFISHAYSWFGASYFFYDIWSMYKVHVTTPPGQINTPSAQMNTPVPPPNSECAPISGLTKFFRYIRLNPIIVGHHLFIGIFGFLVIIYFRGNLGDCVFGFVFLMEASTPFVSLRSVLSRFSMKSTKFYIYNGFTMLIVFFLCRVIMFPYVMYMYAKSVNMDYISAMMSLPTGCKVSISILMLPQLYWFYLMIKGATKILKEPKTNGVAVVGKKKKAAATVES